MRKWKCIRAEYETLTVGKIYTTDNEGYGLINDIGKIHSCLRIQDYGYSKFVEVKDFTKSDLQECDIIVMRNKLRYVYFDGIIVHTNVWSEYLNKYNKDLTRNDNEKRLDVMQVYRNGQLIFKREEQSQRDIKIKELQDKMDAIKREMEELK